VLGHAGDGNLHPTCLTDERNTEEMARVEKAMTEMFMAALEMGGTCTGEHGIGELKSKFLAMEVGEAGLAERARIVMEKPFGTDLASARDLNAHVQSVFPEEAIFRIDHFLGKEAALNILAFRFANGLFEPIWNRQHIDHVQIDVPETLSIGSRAAFYDSTGAFRDMMVTHLLQVMAFMAMEPPTALEPRAISEEKNKVFRSMLPIDPHNVLRGQFSGYLDEPGVAPDSDTEALIALPAGHTHRARAGPTQ